MPTDELDSGGCQNAGEAMKAFFRRAWKSYWISSSPDMRTQTATVAIEAREALRVWVDSVIENHQNPDSNRTHVPSHERTSSWTNFGQKVRLLALPPAPELLRSLKLFQFILNKDTRKRVFEPAYEDLKHQFLESRRFRTKWAQRWIRFAFSFRAIFLVLECFRVMVWDAAVIRPLRRMFGGVIGRWLP